MIDFQFPVTKKALDRAESGQLANMPVLQLLRLPDAIERRTQYWLAHRRDGGTPGKADCPGWIYEVTDVWDMALDNVQAELDLRKQPILAGPELD